MQWPWKKGQGCVPSFESRVLALLEKIMFDVNDVLAKVNAQTTVIAGVGTLITSLNAAIADLKAHPVIQNDPDLLSKVDQIGQILDANDTALGQAVANNTGATGGDTTNTPPAAAPAA